VILLLLGLVGCGTEIAPTPVAVGGSATAVAKESSSPTLGAASVAPTPHQGVIVVVEVVQLPSSATGQHLVAMRLRGDVGTSAVRRSLEIQARMEPIDGSTCDAPLAPTVLRPSHPDAVQPALADLTRTVVVRSIGGADSGAGPGLSAKFRVGPVPSLNGGFEGWVSFVIPTDSADGFCAFDVGGAVVIVAGETTSADLPVVRVDTRDRLDGS
jgi:hypothetical protein